MLPAVGVQISRAGKSKAWENPFVNEPEVRLPTHDRFGKLEDLIVTISEKLGCSKIADARQTGLEFPS